MWHAHCGFHSIFAHAIGMFLGRKRHFSVCFPMGIVWQTPSRHRGHPHHEVYLKPVRVGFVQPLNSHSIGWTTTGRYVWMGYVVLLADTCLLPLKHPVTLFGISEIFHEVSDAKLIQRPKKVLFEV